MNVGHTCAYMDAQDVQYTPVPSGVTPDTYIIVRVHLLRSPVVFEPLCNQNFQNLFPYDLFVVGKRTGEAGQASDNNHTTVITTKLRQTVDEIHLQQRVSSVGHRQTGDQSAVT